MGGPHPQEIFVLPLGTVCVILDSSWVKVYSLLKWAPGYRCNSISCRDGMNACWQRGSGQAETWGAASRPRKLTTTEWIWGMLGQVLSCAKPSMCTCCSWWIQGASILTSQTGAQQFRPSMAGVDESVPSRARQAPKQCPVEADSQHLLLVPVSDARPELLPSVLSAACFVVFGYSPST